MLSTVSAQGAAGVKEYAESLPTNANDAAKPEEYVEDLKEEAAGAPKTKERTTGSESPSSIYFKDQPYELEH